MLAEKKKSPIGEKDATAYLPYIKSLSESIQHTIRHYEEIAAE